MIDLHALDRYRDCRPEVIEMFGSVGDHETGMFHVPSPVDRQALLVLATAGMGWDHVSVSRRTRCPNWIEMSHVAQMFFRPDEVAMQLHVPADEHINNHPFCLHWWRPHDAAIPLPPPVMVGVKGADPERVKLLLAKSRQMGLTETVRDELYRELGLIEP